MTMYKRTKKGRVALSSEAETDIINSRVQASADQQARDNRAKELIMFDDFKGRFTPEEWDLTTDFVEQVDIATGKPERRALKQGLQRVVARNNIDLADTKTDDFLTLLVDGGVITGIRKTEILTP